MLTKSVLAALAASAATQRTLAQVAELTPLGAAPPSGSPVRNRPVPPAPPPPPPPPAAPTELPAQSQPPWVQCKPSLESYAREGDTPPYTNSLLSQLLDPALEQNVNGSIAFMDIIKKVDREVLTEYLQAFDLQSDGYTLLVPSNTAMYLDSSGNPSSAPLLEAYNLTKADITVPLATAIVKAHILPGTYTLANITLTLNRTGVTEIPSVGGYVWSFRWQYNQAESTGQRGLVAVNDAEASREGYWPVQPDVVPPSGVCPNVISTVTGFMVTQYQLGTIPPAPGPPASRLTPELAPPRAAPAPEPMGAGVAPRGSTSPGFGFMQPSMAPGTAGSSASTSGGGSPQQQAAGSSADATYIGLASALAALAAAVL